MINYVEMDVRYIQTSNVYSKIYVHKNIQNNKLTTMFTLLVTTDPNCQFRINDPGLRKDSKATVHVFATVINAMKYLSITHIHAVTIPQTTNMVIERIVDALDRLKDEVTVLTTSLEPRKNVGASQCQLCAFQSASENIKDQPVIMVNAFKEYTEGMFYSLAGAYKPDNNYIVCQSLVNIFNEDEPKDVAFIHTSRDNKVCSIKAKRNVRRAYYTEEYINSMYASVNMVCFQKSMASNIEKFLKEISYKYTDMTLYAFMLREIQNCQVFYMIKTRHHDKGRSGTPSTVVSEESDIPDELFDPIPI